MRNHNNVVAMTFDRVVWCVTLPECELSRTPIRPSCDVRRDRARAATIIKSPRNHKEPREQSKVGRTVDLGAVVHVVVRGGDERFDVVQAWTDVLERGHQLGERRWQLSEGSILGAEERLGVYGVSCRALARLWTS